MKTTTNTKPATKSPAITGKCQICERMFKVRDDGRLNMHGHTGGGRGRCDGWCPGSAFAPAPAVDALEEQVAKFRAEDATRYAGIIGKYERRIAESKSAA